MKPDHVNATFQLGAALFILNNCRLLLIQKLVRGVSVISVTFFLLWGFWNIYWFTYVSAPWSFYMSLLETAANCLWIGLMVYYKQRENISSHQPTRHQEQS